jgi:NTP pyrophosphatase (non-canonical NTP hydrolase)
MDVDKFQELSTRTLTYSLKSPPSSLEQLLAWDALGLCGEAGEVADIIKKSVFHKKGFDKEHLLEELGDVLWYAAALCSHLDTPLSKVLEMNVEKLKKRYPDGFPET